MLLHQTMMLEFTFTWVHGYYYSNRAQFLLLLTLAGFMIFYLMVIQTLTLFASHFVAPHKIIAIMLTLLVMIIVNLSVGSYFVHPSNVPDFAKWLEYASPQKWVLPVLTKDEYSDETISNSGAMQLCRNKHVSEHVE